jgi:hypothetical protein
LKTLVVAAALACLFAQDEEDKIFLNDLGISFVKPPDYRKARPEEVSSPLMRFLLRSPGSDRYKPALHTEGAVMRVSVVGGIFLMVIPRAKNDLSSGGGLTLDNPDNLGKLVPGMQYQNSAKIKIAGRDALAILATIPIQPGLGIPEDAMVRLIFMEHKNSLLLWGFGAIDSEFKPRVKAFEKMMATVRFKGDPEPKPTGKKK